ncbi:MAG: hypothetical protein ABI592_02600 [Acidobacteriota bacterium]
MGILAPASSPEAAPLPPGPLALAAEARVWAAGRSWLWRAPLVLYFAWSGLHRFSDPLRGDFFSGATLGVHELGHVLLFWAGTFLAIAGGSLAQVAAPLAAAAIFHRQRDWFGVTVAGAWLASSLFGLAAYVGDARARELPLVGLTSDPVHDWNWILGRLGLLTWDHALASALRFVSFAVWVAAVAAGAWLCLEMERSRRRRVRPGTRPAPSS